MIGPAVAQRAHLGTNSTLLNSSCPSMLKCLTARCSSQSLVRDLHHKRISHCWRPVFELCHSSTMELGTTACAAGHNMG